MSRIGIPVSVFAAAKTAEATLLNHMQATLKSVRGNVDAEDIVLATFIPKLKEAAGVSSDALESLKLLVDTKLIAELKSRKHSLFDHPERQAHEIFLGNYTMGGAGGASHATKRIGRGVKDGLGDKHPDSDTVYPLFIAIEEALHKGLFKRKP
jgi:hypothetical protein